MNWLLTIADRRCFTALRKRATDDVASGAVPATLAAWADPIDLETGVMKG